jgi:hypothetical protein
MIIGDSWIVTAINTFLGMLLRLGYVVHYMMANAKLSVRRARATVG